MNAHNPSPDSDFQKKSLPYEEGLIGCLLGNMGLLSNLGASLSVEDFCSSFHGAAFTLINEMHDQSSKPDFRALSHKLSQMDGSSSEEIHKYLIHLVKSSSSGIDAPTYARSLKNLSLHRKLTSYYETCIEQVTAMTSADTPGPNLTSIHSQIDDLLYDHEPKRSIVAIEEAAQDAAQQIEVAFRDGTGLSGFSTQLPTLDSAIGGLTNSDLIILAGRPGMGKTALATNIAINIATAACQTQTSQSVPVLFISLEMSAQQLATRILSTTTGISASDLRQGYISEDDLSEVHDQVHQLKGTPLYISDLGGQTISALKRLIRSNVKRLGIKLLVIDYLQLIYGNQSAQKNRTQVITEISAALKLLAKELDMPIIVLSQLSRNTEARDNKSPQLSDLRESGSIEQDADIVMFVYREEYYLSNNEPKTGSIEQRADWNADMQSAKGQAEIIIAKHRHGATQTVTLGFDASRTLFHELDQDFDCADGQWGTPLGPSQAF